MMMGWLAPSGEFTECGYQAHLAYAEKIVEQNEAFDEEFRELSYRYYGNEDQYLLDKGYCEILCQGVIFPKDMKQHYHLITDAQDRWFLENLDQLSSEQQYFLRVNLENMNYYNKRKLDQIAVESNNIKQITGLLGKKYRPVDGD